MRCARCTQGISQNFDPKESKCVTCGSIVNKCPNCVGKNHFSNTCETHTIRPHICLSKCLNQCVLKIDGSSSLTKKTKKRKAVEETHQSKIQF